MKTNKFSFGISVETRDQTGEVIAVYFQIRKGRAKVTREYADGNAFADYDKDGRLLGIEMLAPCSASVLDRIAKHAPERQFVRKTVPRGMLVRA
jgi:uncharacterized protein YuzE